MEKKERDKCATCRCKIDEGMDVIQVEEGIMGLMGFVALEALLLFCCAECLKKYFEPSSGYWKAPTRIP